MAALVIIEGQDVQDFVQYLIERKGYQSSVSGYYPSEGTPGATHWPIKDALPVSTIYHPERSARDCSSEIYVWAKFTNVPVDKVLAFETSTWYVNSEQPSFDNDRLPVQYEDFPGKQLEA